MSGQHFFTKVIDLTDKKRLLVDLAKSKNEIQAKLLDSETIHLTKAFEFNHDRLICILPGSMKSEEDSGNIILSFFIGGEKYFFESQYKVVGGELNIIVPENVFHLQRRNHYRIKIPPGFNALFEITQLNGKLFKLTTPLVDLSAGGCLLQIDVNRTTLTSQDELKGHLFLSDREPISISGKIRHLRKNPANKSLVFVGLQFSALSEREKNRIGSLVMDLYREFFAKYR